MRLYLDDDSKDKILKSKLEKVGHDVFVPTGEGVKDAEHLINAILDVEGAGGRVILTRNVRDFELLSKLVVASGGHHPGILGVRDEREKKLNMKVDDIVRAIQNLVISGDSIQDRVCVLNRYRTR